ncbi:MAG TPA: SET domain-containing protein-lysine N-methyltransferase [Candidatus Angelobacter sp.]|nr:SET domain-containing protein-lysine N-methyltransferase [Candidatus Angelobacter sp.]
MSLIVKSSSLHGAGVYTTAPIKKGARVLEYTGPRLSAKACEGMYADTEVTYLFAMDDPNVIIDGFGMAAFVNHTCDPNCETDQIDDSIWILALRDIASGEELTYDYNLFDGDPGEQAPCYCGLKGCRGTMFSEEEIARQKKILRQRKKRRAAAKARRRRARKAA